MAERYYIFRDGLLCASVATEKEAIIYIKYMQSLETHFSLKPTFSYIYGEEKVISY